MPGSMPNPWKTTPARRLSPTLTENLSEPRGPYLALGTLSCPGTLLSPGRLCPVRSPWSALSSTLKNLGDPTLPSPIWGPCPAWMPCLKTLPGDILGHVAPFGFKAATASPQDLVARALRASERSAARGEPAASTMEPGAGPCAAQ